MGRGRRKHASHSPERIRQMRIAPAVSAVAAVLLVACSSDVPTAASLACDVTNPVASVSVSPRYDTVRISVPAQPSDVVQLTGTAYGRAGNVRTDARLSYASLDTSVATVDSTGLVHLRASGSVIIRASACGQSAEATIVAVAHVATVTISPANDTLVSLDSLLLTATVLDPDGKPVTGDTVTWSTSSVGTSIAATSPAAAMLRTSAAGTTTVTATAEGASGTATVVVLPRVFLSSASAAPAIDAGVDYTCALITMGRVYCWGGEGGAVTSAIADSSCFGHDAEQPDTTISVLQTTRRCALVPRRLGSGLTLTTLSAGDGSACGLDPSGRAWCWGDNTAGQLGNGSAAPSGEPSLVAGSPTFTSVTVGGWHACGLAGDGSAWCWGSDLFGQLGDARTVNSTTPIPVVPDSVTGQVGRYTRMTAGYEHTCALDAGGAAYCWGADSAGQLGAPSTERCLEGSVRVPCSSVPLKVRVPAGITFVTIAAGVFHTCGLDTTGKAWCWGENLLGEVGNGTAGDTVRVPVAVTSRVPFTSLATGTRFTCALDATGAAWCWGDNRSLQLGLGPASGTGAFSSAPAPVASNLRFTRLASGQRHVCGVTADGAAYCWGSNEFGVLGNTLQAANRGLPQLVAVPR